MLTSTLRFSFLMPTRADTRRVERRMPAAKRKYEKALRKFMDDSVFMHQQTYFEFKPQKDSLEVTTYFRLPGDPMKYRFDYEMCLEKRLPRVDEIRNLLWRSFVDYRKQRDGLVRPATQAVTLQSH